MKATVDSHIRIATKELDSTTLEQIKSALTFANPERARAKKENLYGWRSMPPTIQLWDVRQGTLIVPRGFATDLAHGLSTKGITPVWDDKRIVAPCAIPADEVDLWEHQEEAVQAMLRVTQGIWQAPPGAGKTVAVLEAIRRAEQVSLVIVNKLEIAEQWIKRCRDFLGVEMGLIGDGEMDVRDVNVAMQQTLWAKRDELREAGFFNIFGFVCLDECHHLPATTFSDVLQRFPAKFRLGVSATPNKDKDLFPMMKTTLGKVFHKTGREELRKKGILITPSVEIVPTGFKRPFWPTHNHDPHSGNNCDFFPTCKRDQTKRVHRNNYTEVVGGISTDVARNELIALDIRREYDDGHACLVLSDRLEHLRRLRARAVELGVPEDRALMFTGEQTREERSALQELAAEGKVVLFSTVADEALDIPRLDRGFFVWPTRNQGLITQRVGRFERPHPDKADALIRHYADDVSVMKGQVRDALKVYKREGAVVRGASLLDARSRRVAV